MLAAGIILAIMVVPVIASITREVMTAVPQNQREAVLALGATRWEMIRMGVLRNARIGIVGGVILGLGRALGETMAVTMVIGNRPEIAKSLFAPGYTMASVIANEFTEATRRHVLERAGGNRLGAFHRDLDRQRHWRVCWCGASPAELRGHVPKLFGSIHFATSQSVAPAHRLGSDRIRHPGCRLGAGSAACHFRLPGDQGHWLRQLGISDADAKPPGEVGGGMANGIVGTGLILAVASVIGIPLGIGSGIYLAEYGRNRFGDVIRFTADVLNGVPSIVIGITVYSLIVIRQKHFSAFSGGVALGIMMIPTVARATEEMLLMVPNVIREAAYGLGIPRWRTTLSITLRTASAGVITGCMLAFARVAGETAPLLFTAFGNQFWNLKLNQPTAALSLQVYTYAISPYDDWHKQAWAGSLILIVLIVSAVAAVRITTSRGMLKGS